jgi:hypothetical protein
LLLVMIPLALKILLLFMHVLTTKGLALSGWLNLISIFLGEKKCF